MKLFPSEGKRWRHAGMPLIILVLLVLSSSAHLASPASATNPPSPPNLGSASIFGILAAGAVSNTGATDIIGSLGTAHSTAVTGFPPGIVTGTIHKDDSVALQAEVALASAYSALAGDSCTGNLTGQNLGGHTLAPGVYCYSSAASLSGTLTLNLEDNVSSLYVFKIAGALTTSSGSSVVMTGGSGCNVFWEVGGAAVLGTQTAFAGSILSVGSITMGTGTNTTGSVMTQDGSVTLHTNLVGGCTSGAPCAPYIARTYDSMDQSTAIGNALNSNLYSQGVASYYQPTFSSIFQIDSTTVPYPECTEQVETYDVVFLLYNSEGAVVDNLVITESQNLTVLGSSIQPDNPKAFSYTNISANYEGYDAYYTGGSSDYIYYSSALYTEPTAEYPPSPTECYYGVCWVSAWTGIGNGPSETAAQFAQDGTDGYCNSPGCTNNAGAGYQAFYALFPKGGTTTCVGLTINGGDTIYVYTLNNAYDGGSDDEYTFYIEDETSSTSCYTATAMDSGYDLTPSYAYYITEDPNLCGESSTTGCTLAEFGTVSWTDPKFYDWNSQSFEFLNTAYSALDYGLDNMTNSVGSSCSSPVVNMIISSTPSSGGDFTTEWKSSVNTPSDSSCL